MKKVVLYIAMSLDGYIADSRGSVDWIKGEDDSAEMQDTYSPFSKTFDTIIMGKKTYEQIVTELSPDLWPYSKAITYVLTHENPRSDSELVKFRNINPCQLVEELKKEAGKDIWVCGGADIVNQLMKMELIDTFNITIIPVMLGCGTKLFGSTDKKIDLKLVNTLSYNGVVEIIYDRK